MNRPIPEGALAKLDRKDNVLAGIGLMVLAVFLFAVNDALGKWLAERYAAPQILLFRSIAALAILLPVVSRAGHRSRWSRSPRPRLQVLRAFLAASETGLFYAAVAYLPLADAMTYYLAGPIYVTVLAALFLGEKVGWRRWSAIVVGFVGVLIALRPDRRLLRLAGPDRAYRQHPLRDLPDHDAGAPRHAGRDHGRPGRSARRWSSASC